MNLISPGLLPGASGIEGGMNVHAQLRLAVAHSGQRCDRLH